VATGLAARWRRRLEPWEKRLLAAALYMVAEEPEEEVLKAMAELVGPAEAERIACLVWKIAYGEGYTLDEWAQLLTSLRTLSPWECIWRFQTLAEQRLRHPHPHCEPAHLDEREVLRAACKSLGTG